MLELKKKLLKDIEELYTPEEEHVVLLKTESGYEVVKEILIRLDNGKVVTFRIES